MAPVEIATSSKLIFKVIHNLFSSYSVNAGGLASIYGSYNLMDFKQKFVKSLRVPDRPFSAAGVGPARRKMRRDAELIKRIQ